MRKAKFGEDREVEKSVTLLASILVRYPEVSTVNFDSKFHTLKFSFVLKGRVSFEKIKEFEEKLKDCLDAYSSLVDLKLPPVNIGKVEYDDITILEVERDVNSLTQEELSLIVALLHEELGELVVAEYATHLLEEDMLLQEEMIDNILEDMRDTTHGRSFMGYREDGRVLVFNMNTRRL